MRAQLHTRPLISPSRARTVAFAIAQGCVGQVAAFSIVSRTQSWTYETSLCATLTILDKSANRCAKHYVDIFIFYSNCKNEDSPLRCFATLRLWAERVHSVVSIDHLLKGLSVKKGQLGTVGIERVAQPDDIDCVVLGGMLHIIANVAQKIEVHDDIMAGLAEIRKEVAINVGARGIHDVHTTFTENVVRCLSCIFEQRTMETFLDVVSIYRAASLRHYLPARGAQTRTFDVAIHVLELAAMATNSWGDNEFPEAA